jgi:hypothetical protein
MPRGTVYRAPGYSPSVCQEIELLLHFQVKTNNARGNEALCPQPNNMAMVCWNGPPGGYTPLIDNVSIGRTVDVDVLRGRIVSKVIRVKKSGVFVATATDTTWTDGQIGMGFWPKPGATLQSYARYSFRAGNL